MEEIGVLQACAVVNVKTGGLFLRVTQNGESVLTLVVLWCADKRLFSAGGAPARWTCPVVFLHFSGHTVVPSFVIALSVVVSCDGPHHISFMAQVKSSSALCRTRAWYIC